jgi:sortase A
VPQAPDVQATERIITLTTCNPFFSTAERLIAYGVFDRFYPRLPDEPNAGAPEEIVPIITEGAG